MKLLIIPTLNESKNITTLFKKIKKVEQKLNILFESEKGYGNLQDGLAVGVEKYQKGGVVTGITSPATYRHEVEIKSDADLIFFIPNALFQYLFEPMPWRINRFMDSGVFFENLLRIQIQ